MARARTLHPDQQGDTAAMQELNAAWAVLREPASRAEYDRSIMPSPEPAPSPAADGPMRPGTAAWDDEDARVEAELRRRAEEPFDLIGAVVRSLPVLAVLFVLGLVFVVTAFAGGPGSDDEAPVPPPPAPTATP